MSQESKGDVIVFAAHPDDAEMSMAGTMIKMVQSGYRVSHVSLTRGEMSTFGDAATRSAEFAAAAAIIGCEARMLDFPDTGIENTPAARAVVAGIIREIRPKIVFAPYHTNPLGELGGISHVDHAAAGALVRDAVKIARLEKAVPGLAKHTVAKLYFYMLPSHVRPEIFVDVTDVIDRVLESIRAYRSQMEIAFARNQIEDILLRYRAYSGISIGGKYAEGFVTDLPMRFEPKQFFEV